MTEELRQALQRAAGKGEPAVGDAFARFTAVKRRAAIARGATVAVVGIAAAATLMFTLPGLNSGDSGGSLTGGDATTPPQVRAVKHYVDPEGRFEFDYPAELSFSSTFSPNEQNNPDHLEIMDPLDPAPWKEGRPQSWDAYQPDDVAQQHRTVTLNQDEVQRFYLQILIHPGASTAPVDPSPYEAVGVTVSRTAASIDGHAAEREEWRFGALPSFPRPGDDPAGGLGYWCHDCTVTTYVVNNLLPGEVLEFRAVTANAFRDEYRDELDLILESIDLKP